MIGEIMDALVGVNLNLELHEALRRQEQLLAGDEAEADDCSLRASESRGCGGVAEVHHPVWLWSGTADIFVLQHETS